MCDDLNEDFSGVLFQLFRFRNLKKNSSKFHTKKPPFKGFHMQLRREMRLLCLINIIFDLGGHFWEDQ